MTSNTLASRCKAQTEANGLPGLLLRARDLVQAVLMGEHGRRRAGSGDDFWQYRPLYDGENHRMIDWRQSAKTDKNYVREREWKITQTAQLWVDQGASMRFSGAPDRERKSERAQILALALAILLLRAGERVGLSDLSLNPQRGESQIDRLAARLSQQDDHDYAPPNICGLLPHARAVFISDFMGPIDAVYKSLKSAADQDIKGALLQILDPVEISFPFVGRVVFESIGGSLRHETLKANDLQYRYQQRLDIRRAELQDICRDNGWLYHCHCTDASVQMALLWLYQALGQGQHKQ